MRRKALHTPAIVATLGALLAPGEWWARAIAQPAFAPAGDPAVLTFSDEPVGAPAPEDPAWADPIAAWALRLDTGRAFVDVQTATLGAAREDVVTSLRFRDLSGEALPMEMRRRGPARASGDSLMRLELAPSLYIASGRLVQEDDEREEYPDLYAGLEWRLGGNTGLSLGYQHLRQALGDLRPGEPLDPEALFLRFELRF